MTDSIQMPRAAAPNTTAPSTAAPDTTDWLDSTCLGRTCLKWSSDGELTSVDLILVLERLAQADQEMTALRQDSFDSQPRVSIS